jgi:trimethylamine--corrinoid protein Co-methyltransferase
MIANLQVLSENERNEIHERTLSVLWDTGVRVETARGRKILGDAGATVDEGSHIVHFPRSLVEEALHLAPKRFSLGGRRPGWYLSMNDGECALLADGGAFMVLDSESGKRRPAAYDDWYKSTRLIDAIDEFGAYWWMARENNATVNMGDFVDYWWDVFTNTSKHVQDSIENPAQAKWFLEILDVVFGGRETVRHLRPVSVLLCPLSPLTIEGIYTDAYLETVGWDIPVAAMPMPLMGATSPGSLISTVLLGNCEVLAMLCLVQAAAPGTPFLYSPCLAVVEPQSWLYTGGAVEHALLGAAATEMARYYGLPVEASLGGSNQSSPGIQEIFERTLNWTLPTLAWPDILVGPGLLNGSTVLSFEQLMIDVEIFRRCSRLRQGIAGSLDKWLDPLIAQVGPGGHFMTQRSTRDALRSGEWYISAFGNDDSGDHPEITARPDFMDEIRANINQILAHHQPLRLDEKVDKELERIEQRARELSEAPVTRIQPSS